MSPRPTTSTPTTSSTPSTSPPPVASSATQRRTLMVLSAAQVVGAVGVGASVSVGALLALDLSGSQAWSGMAATLTTLGAAAAAIPLTRLAQAHGRRRALSVGWSVAAAGAILAVVAAILPSFTLFLLALMLMGSGNAANLQSRFAATDLALPENRGRALGLVVWATTLGAVAGPNLIRPGASLADALGIPRLAGPFVFSAVAGVIAAAVLAVALRPDPLLSARRLDATKDRADPAQAPAQARRALSVITTSPKALAALVSIVTSHAAMVAVMAMTPVHLNGHGASLTVIGITISLHIAGMFAFAPLVGWIADARGRTPTMLAGQALLITALLITATAGASPTRIALGLTILGIGWSFTTVAASTQLAESVSAVDRPRVQGTSDLLMNLAAAAAGALSGVLVVLVGYTGLSLAAIMLVLPAIAVTLAARPRRARFAQP